MVAAWLIGLPSCLEKDATFWAPYNGEDDRVLVFVRSDVQGAVDTDLRSSTGSVTVGTATVDPGAGPVGTEHFVTVEVDEAFVEDVGRVTLEIEGDRGATEHELMQDSALAGTWVVQVTSVGEEQESREDSFRFVLWQESEKDDPGAVKEE